MDTLKVLASSRLLSSVAHSLLNLFTAIWQTGKSDCGCLCWLVSLSRTSRSYLSSLGAVGGGIYLAVVRALAQKAMPKLSSAQKLQRGLPARVDTALFEVRFLSLHFIPLSPISAVNEIKTVQCLEVPISSSGEREVCEVQHLSLHSVLFSSQCSQ